MAWLTADQLGGNHWPRPEDCSSRAPVTGYMVSSYLIALLNSLRLNPGEIKMPPGVNSEENQEDFYLLLKFNTGESRISQTLEKGSHLMPNNSFGVDKSSSGLIWSYLSKSVRGGMV